MKTLLFCLALSTLAFSAQAQTKPPVKTGMAEVNGTKLYYEVAGEGQPLVLIHGSYLDCRNWDDQFLPLSKKFKVIRYDVRGYGKSAMPDPDIEYTDYDDLRSLLDYLGIGKAHICGSYHGIAVDFAIAHPNSCLSLIAAAPWINGYRSPAIQKASEVLFRPARIILTEQGAGPCIDFWLNNEVWKGVFIYPGTLEKVKQMVNDHTFWYHLKNKKQLLKPAAAGRLAEINVPTLIVTAEYDLEFCKEMADLMEKEIAGAKKVSIRGAGHYMNIDKPKEFNGILVKFIRDIDQKRVL
jgi:pimeloyl-ACP methyl ester carboxylesterase